MFFRRATYREVDTKKLTEEEEEEEEEEDRKRLAFKSEGVKCYLRNRLVCFLIGKGYF